MIGFPCLGIFGINETGTEDGGLAIYWQYNPPPSIKTFYSGTHGGFILIYLQVCTQPSVRDSDYAVVFINNGLN